jgi:hypothetical protein
VNIGWDGYFQGELVDEGVYTWRIWGIYNNGKTFDLIGTFLLIR